MHAQVVDGPLPRSFPAFLAGADSSATAVTAALRGGVTSSTAISGEAAMVGLVFPLAIRRVVLRPAPPVLLPLNYGDDSRGSTCELDFRLLPGPRISPLGKQKPQLPCTFWCPGCGTVVFQLMQPLLLSLPLSSPCRWRCRSSCCCYVTSEVHAGSPEDETGHDDSSSCCSASKRANAD